MPVGREGGAFGSLRADSGRVRVAPGSRQHRGAVRQTLMAEGAYGADVARPSFLVKVEVAGCGLFPLVGGGQSIGDGCLCWDLRNSEMGGPSRYVSGLSFAPTSNPVVKFC